jgi:hypothetical protein
MLLASVYPLCSPSTGLVSTPIACLVFPPSVRASRCQGLLVFADINCSYKIKAKLRVNTYSFFVDNA